MFIGAMCDITLESKSNLNCYDGVVDNDLLVTMFVASLTFKICEFIHLFFIF